ncbi:uncharacterized protein SRS1_14287 [Sporisorium reilianum f. sp. reilianum]|uniref:Rab-GAP TBC domain-containing protein n=1 Tax=Sporisorium reilianum f. sp. reilianum TaxID=72559 RepID=A0A2N8UFD9_9BASI|nr:uncharacterized protein SRS1_14287 [Sporisorium reilianum f. sp. reilianum]
MASSHDSDALSDAIPPVDDASNSPPASQASDHAEQASLDTDGKRDVHVVAATEETLTVDESSPTAAAQPHESNHATHESTKQETPLASDASDDDDGDISLVTSPKVDQNASAGGASSSLHRRIDSVPPQKYSVSQDAASSLSTALASTSLHPALEEEDEADISIHQHHEDGADISFGSRSSATHHPFGHDEDSESLSGPATIDKADLNFVDITLDAPEQETSIGANTLEPINPLAGSARTAEQIRQDSVCSQSVQTSTIATPADAEQDLSKHDRSPPLSPIHGNASGNRSVEGRYRGRRSAATSRAASPVRSPSPSPSASRRGSMAPPENRPSIAPAPILLASDEHGNISVVSDVPVSPRTVPEGGATLPTEPQQPDSAIASSQASPPTTKVAASLSDEVTAADPAAASQPPAPNQPDSTTTTNGDIAPPTPGLSDKADQVDAKKRRKSSSAAADPVESRTRMTTLPAKPKTEEIKHRADFERMMMAAKEAERRRRDEEEERKRRRQDEQREALARWEKDILPSWSRARKDPELEQLWWQGAPPSIRGRVWALAIGNPLMLPRNLLEMSEKKAAGSGSRPIEASIPPRVLGQIDQDVQDTLPSLKLFQASGPLHEDLVRLCRAFVLVRMEQLAELDVAGNADRAASRHQHVSPLSPKIPLPHHDEGAPAEPHQDDAQDEYARRGIDIYQPGLASLAAVLLINMPINTAFIALLNLLHAKPWLKALYSLLPTIAPPSSPALASTRKPAPAPKDKAIRGFERVFETLLADQMPQVYANLLAHRVELARVVLRTWVATLWTAWLDVDTVMRLWDVVLLDETDSVIYRVCLALVHTLEARLYVPEHDELESVLRGTNAAALAVWRRDKHMRGELDVHATTARAPPVDEAATTSLDSHAEEADTICPRDYIYEQYAIQEHHVFATLEAQKAWWKQSTLQRLLDRELSE